MPSGVNLDLSTWATRFCSSATGVLIPTLSARLLRREKESQDWIPAAEFTTGVTVDLHSAGKGWRSAVAAQQAFIREQDADTKRIAYLYDQTKAAPPEGQFFHDVHIPTPRPPSDVEESEDSFGEDTESEHDSDASTSSAGSSSDAAEAYHKRLLVGRRSAHLKTRRDSGHGSSSEEGSVSESKHSSAPSCEETTGASDPSNHLAEKIKRLRSMRQPLIDFEAMSDPSHKKTASSIQAAEHRGGSIISVTVLPVAAALDPSAALPIAELMTGFRDLVSFYFLGSRDVAHIQTARPDLVLDRLLIAHTGCVDILQDNELPTIIKVAIPVVKARIHPGTTFKNGPVVDLQLSGLAGQRSRRLHDGISNYDGNVTLDHLKVYLCSKSPETQLDASSPDPLPGAPVAQLLSDNLSIDLDGRSHRQRLVVRCAQLSAGMVTPALKQGQRLQQIWRHANDKIPKAATRTRPAALILYNVTRAAVEQNLTLAQPAFVHESSYGLQHDDDQSIRRNLGWLILTRVRHWMRTMGRIPDFASADMADDTVKALRTVHEFARWTDMVIRQECCIQIAFDGSFQRPDSHIPSLESDSQVFVKVDILQLVHEGKLHEEKLAEKSVVTLFSTSIGTRYRTYLAAGQRTNQLRSVNTIKDVQVELRDSILPVISAAYDLLPNAPNHGPQVSAELPLQHWSLIVDNHIAQCDLHLVASGLRFSGSLSKSYANIISKTGPGTVDRNTGRYANQTVLGGLQRVTMALLIDGDSQGMLSLPSNRTIASVSSNDLKTVISRRQSPNRDAAVQQQIGVSLGHIAFDVYPQVKSLGAFLVDWKREHYLYVRDPINGT